MEGKETNRERKKVSIDIYMYSISMSISISINDITHLIYHGVDLVWPALGNKEASVFFLSQ